MMNTPIRIKTFRSKTLQDAFQQIRTEFGAEASILETKTTKFGVFGRSRIEVTASTHSHVQEPKVPEQSELDSETQTESVRIEEPALADEQESINANPNLNNDLVEPVIGNAKPARIDGVLGQLYQELLAAGIEAGIVCQWIEAIRVCSHESVKQDIWTVRSELLGWIRGLVHAAPPISVTSSQQQVIALIGPTGAGKTTTLAKIAASLSIEHGLSVGVLSTDSLRLGSNHLLKNYAEMLGWQFDVADSVEHLSTCMQQLSGCRFVLIDASGFSPADPESSDELQELLDMAKPTETHLVVSSTCSVRSFLRYERYFEKLNPNRLILTRLDEAGGLGSLFSCMQNSALPISYLTNGRNIPNDLIQATEMRLSQHIMAL